MRTLGRRRKHIWGVVSAAIIIFFASYQTENIFEMVESKAEARYISVTKNIHISNEAHEKQFPLGRVISMENKTHRVELIFPGISTVGQDHNAFWKMIFPTLTYDGCFVVRDNSGGGSPTITEYERPESEIAAPAGAGSSHRYSSTHDFHIYKGRLKLDERSLGYIGASLSGSDGSARVAHLQESNGREESGASAKKERRVKQRFSIIGEPPFMFFFLFFSGLALWCGLGGYYLYNKRNLIGATFAAVGMLQIVMLFVLFG